MVGNPELYWLPRQGDWSRRLGAALAWPEFCALARSRIDALETRINSKKPDTGGGGRGIR